MKALLLICLGGAAGTGARYLLSTWALRMLGNSFPFGTLTVNLLGSFAMGALVHLGMSSQALSPTARLVLTTGFLGGFTTYSTFSTETMQLIQEGALPTAALNVAVTVVACLAASFVGFVAARSVVGG